MSTQDRHLDRVRAALGGQEAPASPHGGVRVLYRCRTCGRPWLMNGRTIHLRGTDDEIAAWAHELGADLGALPYASCRICSAQSIGEIAIDEYGHGAGYGLSWEASEPTGAHLLGTVVRLDYLRSSDNQQASVVTNYPRCRAWLDWLARLTVPAAYRTITPQISAVMAQSNPPGYGAPGTDTWLWRGAIWQAPCPALGERSNLAQISLAQAMPPQEPFAVPTMIATWRALAQFTREVNIPGEAR